MEIGPTEQEQLRAKLVTQKRELETRVNRIHEHAREPLDADSSEQAAQLGNVEVVSALENEAVQEIAQIDGALRRLEAGSYGTCITCGEEISTKRLEAWPVSAECLDCAETSSPR